METLPARDWQRLRALRDRFLTDARDDYWTARDLELYDAVFAPRIGWKWAGALAAIAKTGWRPRSTRILDWGCGTGIAARTAAAWSGIRSVDVFDESSLAAAFTCERLVGDGLTVGRRLEPNTLESGTLLLVSHVLGELDEGELGRLAALAATADEILWIEPGSRDVSRRLGRVHNALQRSGHHLLAPCTNQQPCPMLEPANERHWCHFFADPPNEIFQSAFWREASRQLEIDLRSLPYSFLATSRLAPPAASAKAERLIGHPRQLKAHCKLLCCGADGLVERTLQRREDPDLYRRILKKRSGGVFTWRHDPDKPDHVISVANATAAAGPPPRQAE